MIVENCVEIPQDWSLLFYTLKMCSNILHVRNRHILAEENRKRKEIIILQKNVFTFLRYYVFFYIVSVYRTRAGEGNWVTKPIKNSEIETSPGFLYQSPNAQINPLSITQFPCAIFTLYENPLITSPNKIITNLKNTCL